MENEQNVEKPLVITSWIMQPSIFIPLTLFIAYLLALSYEEGYGDYFTMPPYLISLNPNTVLDISGSYVIIISALTIFGVLLYPLANLIEAYASKTPTRRFFIPLCTFNFMLVVCLIALRFNKENRTFFMIVSISLALGLIGPFVLPFFMRKREGTYWNKLIPDITLQRRLLLTA